MFYKFHIADTETETLDSKCSDVYGGIDSFLIFYLCNI